MLKEMIVEEEDLGKMLDSNILVISKRRDKEWIPKIVYDIEWTIWIPISWDQDAEAL